MAIVATTYTFNELVARKVDQCTILALVAKGDVPIGIARRYLAYLASPGNWGKKRTLKSLVDEGVTRMQVLGMLSRGNVTQRTASRYLSILGQQNETVTSA